MVSYPYLCCCIVAVGLVGRALGEEGEAEEKHGASPVESAISVMLLGSIGFQMLLFYLVHWEDADIRRYAWRVISQTISIFCAVLLFQGFNGLIEEYLVEGAGEFWEVVIDMGQMVFWLTAMQLMLAITSGAVNELWGGTRPDMKDVEINVKSLALLLSHVAGFSAINAWGSMQHVVFGRNPFVALLVLPIACFGLLFVYHGFDIFREHVSKSDDGEVDEYEEKWDEETEECENDVAGLSLSFLTVQAIRFAVGGHLPDTEGGEPLGLMRDHGLTQWLTLIGCGMVCGALGISLLYMEGLLSHDSAGYEFKRRCLSICGDYFTFGNAWCLYYGVEWALSSQLVGSEEALLHVIISLFLSAVAFMMIFVLDKVIDNELVGEGSEQAVETIILAFGVLVGFAWEQSFDAAVGVVADAMEGRFPKAGSKLVMSMVLVIIVFPAWRFYILPLEQELAEDAEEEHQDKVRLKIAAGQHYKLMMEEGTDDHALDLAHLKMKQHRRFAHGVPPAGNNMDGLRHLQVTAQGITEITPDMVGPNRLKVKVAHQKGAEQLNLLV